MDTGLLEGGHLLSRPDIRHLMQDAQRRCADMQERAPYSDQVACVKHARKAELEFECREAAPLRPHVRRGHPETCEYVPVGGGEAMDVGGKRRLTQNVDLLGLDRVTGRLEKALRIRMRGRRRHRQRSRLPVDSM